MKKQKYEKYIYLSLSGFGAIALSILLFFLIDKGKEFKGYLGMITSTLMPFIYGGVMAYLLYPVSQWIEKQLGRILGGRMRRLTTMVGILLSLTLLFSMVYLLVAMVLPQLIESIVSIVTSMPTAVDNLTKWLSKLLENDDSLKNYAEIIVEQASGQFEDWLTSRLLPSAQTLITGVSSSVIATVMGLVDFIIGVIVAIYIMSSADRFKRQARLMVKGIFPKHVAEVIFEITYEMDQSFGGFIRGKILDSLIIGALCFGCLTLMKMPYAMLISVIVGVTNVIPFFGPYVGAVPSALLILMVSPIQCLYFLIFILILQQIDGNIIGPTILGQSTGLSSFWVLFSILVFGKMFGFVGMIIGVPLFSVIYYIISKLVFKLLRKKGLESEILEYREHYPDKRIERDEKKLQKTLGRAERDQKWQEKREEFLDNIREDKKEMPEEEQMTERASKEDDSQQ